MMLCMVRRRIFVLILIAMLLLVVFSAPVEAAAPVTGEVTFVDGTNVEIKLQSKGAVRTGDRVELSYVTSTGMDLPVGTWRVKTVKGTTVTAEMADSPTRPVAGLKAKIYPRGKADVKAPSKPTSPVIGPGKPAAPPSVTGNASKVWLGVEIDTVQAQGSAGTGLLGRITGFLGGKTVSGVVVVYVYSGSPADRSGTKINDNIIELNGKPVTDHTEFARSISLLPAGVTVNITVMREGTRLPLTATLSTVPEYMTISDKAKKYYDGQQFEQAAREYARAINLKPDVPYFYFYRGYARYRLNQVDLAMTDFSKSLELNPNSSAAYAFRGLTKAMKNQPDAALDDYNKALALDPGQGWVYRERSVAWEMKGKLDEALNDINRAIEYVPKAQQDNRFLSELYVDRAKLLNRLTRVDDAMEDLRKALEIDPNIAQAYGFRGHLLVIKGDYRQALTDLNRALELDRNLFAAYETRSRAYEALGSVKEALSDMKKALSLRPTDPYIQEQVRRLTSKASGKR